jgi:HTH-type transcriptional regulator, sugar sensing transcriptional regulator
MQETVLLKSLGLSDAEVAVYLSLLKSGPVSIRQVADDTNINRGTTYEALKSLVSWGLVGFNQKGERRKFIAEHPRKIYELIADKKRELGQLEESARSIVPSLLAHSERQVGEPVVRFYEDDEGIVAILRDVLTTTAKLDTKEYRVYSSKPLRQYIYRSFPNFTRRRIKEGIFCKAIAVGEGGDPVENAERRWLPQPSDERFSSYVLIYGDKVAQISVSADETPYGVIIEEPGVAAMQRYLFDTLWSSIKM